MTTRAGGTIKETVFTHLASKVKARAKAKEIVIIADRPGITQESAPTHKRAKAKDSKCYNCSEKGSSRKRVPERQRRRKAKRRRRQLQRKR